MSVIGHSHDGRTVITETSGYQFYPPSRFNMIYDVNKYGDMKT